MVTFPNFLERPLLCASSEDFDQFVGFYLVHQKMKKFPL